MVMRRINSEFKTVNMSEEGQKLSNRDYFGYVEMDDFACYVLADSLDEELSINSAKLVVESIIRDFTETPSIGKRQIKKYLKKAHNELLKQKKGMHLKASVIVAVTNYQTIRYCHVGNSRLYLIRNGRILDKTIDQSLTQNLLEEQKITKDQVASHEERNNLYSFLGERGTPKFEISKKKKLEDGDIFTLLTRGVWEQCEEKEFLEIVNVANEPEEILHETEDFILKRQEKEQIDNYTLAVTFVNKVYQSPKKPWTVKKVLMIALPILISVGGISLGMYLRHRNIQQKTEALEDYMESGETYLRYDNYQKAAQEYTEAKKLADSLKKKEDAKEADQNKKLAEQILLADEAMIKEEYEKAQELYMTARELSIEAGNIGKTYIESQLKRVGDYIEIFDLIAIGEAKEEYGNLEGAVEAYKEAKEKATDLYYKAGKEEALEKLAVVEEQLDKEKLEEEEKQKAEEVAQRELENQQKTNDMQNAIDIENKGNELLAEEQYERAITFYQTAQAIYVRLELPDLADAIYEKIAAAKEGIEAKEEAEKKAEEEAKAKEEAEKKAAEEAKAKEEAEKKAEEEAKAKEEAEKKAAEEEKAKEEAEKIDGEEKETEPVENTAKEETNDTDTEEKEEENMEAEE